MKKIREWFTDARRQALHAAFGSVAALAVAVGWINEDQSTVLLGFAGSALALAQGVVGLALLRPSDAARWFPTAGRGLIYAAAAAAGAVGIAFGLWGDADVTYWLGIGSVGLTVVSSFLSVVNVQTVPASPDGVPLSRREYRAQIAPRA
ncbi:hypothetical protein [Microbacterium caowuchunii]|uniref:Uncharacterized protein n=1 Tax=Microbacterium caowuchunii TaxID=2614638 RepID=A0A5N0TFH0_9MICO|nr:hypothetical protein [Microbacterium caowuchunii]KAA9133770.1 hypothetical protein F6B40_08445 [Microbacterium caowuchunii]